MNVGKKTGFGYMPDGVPVEEALLTDGAISCGIITVCAVVNYLASV